MSGPDRRKVWLVDDSPLQAELSRRVIALVHDVRVFASGETALEAIAGEEAPDLLIVDWNMPGVSGAEVCRYVRLSRDAATLPILVLTGADADATLAEAFGAGANDFVRKGAPAAELEARVASLLRTKVLHDTLRRTEATLAIEGQFRERFMGMLAHDLRQPLNTFQLANQVLERKLPLEARAPLEMQRKAAERMSRMIRELLDFTRIRPETGMPIDRQRVDLEVVVRECIEQIRVGHPGRAIELATSGPAPGSWDRDRIAQVCSNLIDNALAHGDPASPVEVALAWRDDGTTLTVANQGAPIPEEGRRALFQPFQRGPGASRSSGSVGLGLHIVSEIARAHGGMVSASSDAERTTFSVSLPNEAPLS